MDSSSLNPQEEVKGDAITSDDNNQQNNEENNGTLGNDQQTVNIPSSEERNEKETGQAEVITNSIANNLLLNSNENINEGNIQNDDNDVCNDENNCINKDEEKIENQTSQNTEAENTCVTENREEKDINDSIIQENENKDDSKAETKDNDSINFEKENANNLDADSRDNDKIETENNDDDKAKTKEDDNNSTKIENEDNNSIENDDTKPEEDEKIMLQFSHNFSDEDVQYAFDQMYESGKTPETSMFPQLLQLIFREKADAINDQNYDRAKKLENMVSSINRENDSYSYSYSMTPDTQSRYFEERDSRLQQQLKDTKAKYKVKLEHHNENCELKIKELQEKQQLEINELKSKYQDPSFLMRFNRPSQQLLYLRKCERKLALSRKYEEARQMKKIADNQQQLEEKEMQEIAQQSMQAEYVKLVEKQKKDMERLLQFDKKMTKDIKVAKQKEITPIRRAIKQTAIRKVNSEAKRPFYSLSSSSLSSGTSSPFSHSLGARSYNPELARDVMAKNQTLATPRTLQKIKSLKDRDKVELNVEPIDDSTFAKLEQMNARRVKSMLPKL